MSTQAELKKAIDDLSYHISRIEGELENADTFGEAEVLRSHLEESKFNLAKLQKELHEVEQATQEKARSNLLAAYEGKYSGYLQGLTDLDKLTDEFMTKLQALEDLFTRRYDLTQELNRVYWNQLRNEAKAMGLPEPSPLPNQSSDPEQQLWTLCKGLDGTVARKLSDQPDPLVVGGWARAQ
jgi:predicted  nucleic acid-binding Zn-ribbon protein